MGIEIVIEEIGGAILALLVGSGIAALCAAILEVVS
jgi:hypothetical protein